MPFLVITVEAGLRSMNRRLEEAARTLGAHRWTVFWRVTLPLIAPAQLTPYMFAKEGIARHNGVSYTPNQFIGTTASYSEAKNAPVQAGSFFSAAPIFIMCMGH